MLNLAELKSEKKLLNEIDWEMTHEDAVRLYLEWGNNWASGNYVIRSKDDVSYYFVVNTWGKNPRVFLMKRNSEDAQELAELKMPEDVERRFLESIGHNKGVYSIEGEVKHWLMKEFGEC
jgi:hypothetical protein